MWVIAELQGRPAELDFGPSGQASRPVTRVVADGVVLFNAVELAVWRPDALQALVCEDCGIERCAPGGWIAARRAGEHALFVPAFARMAGRAEDRDEHAPPAYLAGRGVPLMTAAVYARLRQLAGLLPPLAELPALSGAELVGVVQHEAPLRVLGRIPDPPRLQRGAVLASTQGDGPAAERQLEAAVTSIAGARAVSLRRRLAEESPITLFLDGPGAPEWTVLAAALGSEPLLMPATDLVAVPLAG